MTPLLVGQRPPVGLQWPAVLAGVLFQPQNVLMAHLDLHRLEAFAPAAVERALGSAEKMMVVPQVGQYAQKTGNDSQCTVV